MNLTIVLNGKTFQVVPKPGDLVRFERQYNIPASSLGENVMLEHVFFIAWSALKRLDEFEGDFEEFLDLADVAGDDTAPFDPPPPPA